MSLSDLFLCAGAWPLVLVGPLAGLALHVVERRRSARLAAIVGPRMRALAPHVPTRRRSWGRACFAVALLLGAVATLHPAWGAPRRARTWAGVDVVLCLDVSRSMRATDVLPDRLTRAKEEVRALADRFEGGRLGLVLFAGEARVVAPLTHDAASVATLADLADATSVARGGTDLGAALDAAVGLLEGTSARVGAVVLLTDGEDLEERGLAVARRSGERGVAVHALGFGTPRGGKIAREDGAGFLADRSGAEVVTALDHASLARIAAASGGAVGTAADGPHPLVSLYERHLLPAARASFQRAGGLEREDRYQGPLFAALLLFLLDLALAGRGRR